MSRKMFMGTREVMLEIPCPQVTMPSSKNGWSTTLDFLNGGSSVRRSTAASKRYEMTWPSISRDEARNILDLADRLYGSGEIYWLDPFVADRNMLPQHWASPMQGLYDGLPLIGTEKPEPGFGYPLYGFPVQSATYNILEGDISRNIWIPVPNGHTAHIGIYGVDGTGGQVLITPTMSSLYEDTPIVATLMSEDDNSRANTTVKASDGYNGFTLSFGGLGTITVFGMIVQVLEDGKIPTPGNFISGQGHSGCQFVTQPLYTPYSAAFDIVGMTASFVETGSWEQ